ncbi:hypothetical protein K504DRAFT_239580 [Pleomassaria siparia CBS 279.74]|uniref:Uncharacterized protein n=1 Tax=Pleomassaria siparia CBS 279.74 TaxID=1314801 RepID=A0A6G1KDK4_9PLEO|nr:hypothetical protein K504DRAFT_239580 [Pleomassaria siparia CBS 279.74]
MRFASRTHCESWPLDYYELSQRYPVHASHRSYLGIPCTYVQSTYSMYMPYALLLLLLLLLLLRNNTYTVPFFFILSLVHPPNRHIDHRPDTIHPIHPIHHIHPQLAPQHHASPSSPAWRLAPPALRANTL